jgi:Tfp pilus assembly protein PilF
MRREPKRKAIVPADHRAPCSVVAAAAVSRLMVASALLAAGACASSSGGPGAQDPERMSESEYDVARDLWLRQNKPREALEHALKARDLDDRNADAAHLVALLYLDFCQRTPDECRLGEAEKHARRALDARPDFREAKNTLGVVLIHERRYEQAVQVLEPLTRDILYQTPENAWGNLGWAYLELGRLEPAIDALRRSVAAQPLFCVGNFRLGLAYEKKRDLAPAVEAYTRAVETSGCERLQDAYQARGRVQLRLGNADAARADLARCAELSGGTTAGKECRSMLAKLK